MRSGAPPTDTRQPHGRWAIAIAGMCALATAMGIGRFAFTPLLPMMLHDGVVTLAGASWLATANYIGYLVGALLCTFQPWIWRQLARGLPALPPVNAPWMVKLGLALTVLLTVGMAIPYSATWPLLRFASGVASALVFVYSSSFCLQQLARLGVPGMGGLIYIGPGAGIVVTGLFASVLVAWGAHAVAGWLIFGALALVLSLWIAPVFRPQAALASSAAAPVAPAVNLPTPPGEMPMLSLAYGLAGFGYIITATFLPVIARQAIPGSPWLDLFWPIFGSGVMIGAVIASRIPAGLDNRVLLTGCFVVQALGIAIGIVSPSAPGFAFGSLLLGLPFTAITYFAMQEVRRLKPASAPSYIGLLTTIYGLGQIAGPPLVALLLRHSATPGEGFQRGLEIAAGSLVLGAVMFALMARLYPVVSSRAAS